MRSRNSLTRRRNSLTRRREGAKMGLGSEEAEFVLVVGSVVGMLEHVGLDAVHVCVEMEGSGHEEWD